MKPELIGMKAGPKTMYLRQHRTEILDYFYKYGAEATRAEYGMKPDTWERFLKRGGHDTRINRLSENDKWVLRIANEGIRDNRRRILALEEFREGAEPLIELGKTIIKIGVGDLEAKLGNSPLLQDKLSLANIVGKLE